jgi:2-phospho-L-lactate guanylyltransferase (CobY/MobA/RfbA family)
MHIPKIQMQSKNNVEVETHEDVMRSPRASGGTYCLCVITMQLHLLYIWP